MAWVFDRPDSAPFALTNNIPDVDGTVGVEVMDFKILNVKRYKNVKFLFT